MKQLDTNQALLAFALLSALMLLILILLYAYLAYRKATYNKRQLAVYEMVRDLEQPDSALETYLATGEASRRLSIREPYRMEALQEALQHRLSISNTPEERRLIYEFAERYFSGHYREALRNRRWSTRMNTLLWIEQFRIHSLQPELIRWMKAARCSDEEHFQILRILSKLNSDQIVPFLSQKDHNLSDSQLLQILLPLNEELIDQLLAQFDTLPRRVRYNLMDALRIHNVRSTEVLALLERQLSHYDGEIRIRALKTIANFGYMSREATRLLVDVLEDEHDHPERMTSSWPERLMRAKVMGNVHEDVFVSYLLEMLGDSSYRVRQQAAESLSNYKNGLELLAKVVAGEHADRYAREMAEETLERKQYERNLA
ncbi:HEAT repeat domain-containing protein [Paenibacillus hunanensis]|uniref:HEAT repeat domain-containing protein n=1 Tax=Paenibacillus hunanensis TaxID=539262 RepID=UPI002A69A51A|nr:HEAT repeat domain-containing protein [Paenibacillus hunanensis]WPP41107.1 HEAT repeat domain-containing protein [Paenibacillus hunanensis]